MLDASDMNRRESTEMHAIDESIMNRLPQTHWKSDAEATDANRRDPRVRNVPGAVRRA